MRLAPVSGSWVVLLGLTAAFQGEQLTILLNEFSSLAGPRLQQSRPYRLSLTARSISIQSIEHKASKGTYSLSVNTTEQGALKSMIAVSKDYPAAGGALPLSVLKTTLKHISSSKSESNSEIWFSKRPEEGKVVHSVLVSAIPGRPGAHYILLIDDKGKLVRIIPGA